MFARNQPSIPTTQSHHNTSGETSGNPRFIEQRTSPVPAAGIFNNSNNTQAQHSIFSDFSGSLQPVVHNVMNVTHGSPDGVWCLLAFGSELSYRGSAMPGLHQLLQPVNASYQNRSGKKAQCLQGTRKDILETIQKWADRTSLPVCWLNGSAGSGKSTIAQTIAEWCADERRLATSFFFFRGIGNRDKISHLIPTLAFQLSTTVRGMEPLLQNALNKEPSILNTPLSYQFDKLIMEPMLACSKHIQNFFKRKRMVIVIDGLDECGHQDRALMDEFIDAVVDACGARNGRVPFCLFITSRVEEYLRKKLETPSARNVTLQLKLQNFNAAGDIHMFFQSEFETIYDANRLLMTTDKVPEPWPLSEVLDTLVKEALGSYIYSSTFVNFVSRAGGMPHRKLLDALKAHGLDDLYSQVFSNALYPDGVPGNMVDLMQIMGTLLLLEDPLPIKHLALLLNISSQCLVEVFLSIQSILLIPKSDDDLVQLVHTSLRDFLMAPARSGNYFINPPTRHLSIAINCLNIMERNKAEFWFGVQPLSYTFKEWLNHLHKALSEEEQYPSDLSLFFSLKDSLTNFASSSLDPWLHSIIMNNMNATIYKEAPLFSPQVSRNIDVKPIPIRFYSMQELSKYPQGLLSMLAK